MGFSRELWVRMGRSAAEGHRVWSGSAGMGGFERALWMAATVLMAIPILALLIIAVLGAVALTLAAVLVASFWGLLVRLGLIRRRNVVTVIRTSPRE